MRRLDCLVRQILCEIFQVLFVLWRCAGRADGVMLRVDEQHGELQNPSILLALCVHFIGLVVQVVSSRPEEAVLLVTLDQVLE
jgi:hypothetical protein